MTKRTQPFRAELSAESFNERSRGYLPALAGVEIVKMAADAVESRLLVRSDVMAPNGFLHAASVIALADTSCGYGCIAHLPEGASGFTTIELKANFLGTAREGWILCRATPVHLGRTTQVWDAVVNAQAGQAIALFRCTQMLLSEKRP